MVTRAPFLKTRYGGYFHRDVPEENAELSHVGPGPVLPCGEPLRSTALSLRIWVLPSGSRRSRSTTASAGQAIV